MEGTMKTAVMTGISQVEIQERPIPVPADNEVLVKVEYVGICGSDLHYYESGSGILSWNRLLYWDMKRAAP